MRLNTKNILIGSALLLLLASCANQETTTAPGESSGKQNLNLTEADWEHDSQKISDSVHLQSKTLKPEAREKSERIVRESALESLNLPSHLKVTAFTVRSKGNVRSRQAVFIAPKLYFYRKAEGAHVQARKIGNKVLIPLHAILVDGFSKQIPKVDGIEQVQLPESYLVNEPELRKALSERGYDDSTSVGPLDGCVKEMAISVAGDTYQVTPAIVSASDFCELNRPFTVNLIVPEEKADYVINEALYRSEADASASFRVQVGYVDSDTRIQMDRSKIYEKLEASLQGQYPPYFKAEISAKLKSIIQTETMNIFIKGDRTDIINQLVQMAYDSFVQPYELKGSVDTAKPECVSTTVCVSLNYEKNKEQRSLEVGFQQYSTTMTEKTITTLAKPQQILFPEVVFNSENDSLGTVVDNRADYKNERHLAVTVNEGTTVELILNGFKHEIDNTKVNVSEGGWVRCASRDFTNRCEWHEHGVNIDRSYAGISETAVMPFAGNILGNPTKELEFRFLRPDQSSIVCNLSDLNAIGDGTKYVVKFVNSARCPIFDNKGGPKENINVVFINRLRDPNKLKAVNGREAFTKRDTYTKQDSKPAFDSTELGGHTPASIVELERAIKLQLKILVRKYDIQTF